jgi:hypothetical protein
MPDPTGTVILTPESIGGSGLASCDLLGHVQQQFLVVGFHFREEPTQFREVISFAALAPEFVILRRFHLAQSCGYFTVIKQAIHRHFERACHLLQGFNSRNGVAVFNAGNVAAQQPGSFFDVALRELCSWIGQRDLSKLRHLDSSSRAPFLLSQYP